MSPDIITVISYKHYAHCRWWTAKTWCICWSTPLLTWMTSRYRMCISQIAAWSQPSSLTTSLMTPMSKYFLYFNKLLSCGFNRCSASLDRSVIFCSHAMFSSVIWLFCLECFPGVLVIGLSDFLFSTLYVLLSRRLHGKMAAQHSIFHNTVKWGE